MNNTRKLLLLSGGAAPPITWLFRDEFTTDTAASSEATRICDPGPGTLLLNNNSNNISTNGGSALITNSASRVVQIASSSQTRASGLALITKAGAVSGGSFVEVGILNGSNARLAYLSPRATADFISYNGDAAFVECPLDLSGSISDFAIVLGINGWSAFSRVDGYWEMFWWDGISSTTPVRLGVWPWISSPGNNVVALDHFRIRQLESPFNSSLGWFSLNEAAPTGSFSGEADAIIDITIATPGSLTDSVGVKYRVQDASNYWYMYVDSAGAFRVDSVASGIATNRVNVAGVIAGSQTRTLRVHCRGSVHNFYTLSGSTYTKRGSAINVNHVNTSTAIQIIDAAGYTLSNLRLGPLRKPDLYEPAFDST